MFNTPVNLSLITPKKAQSYPDFPNGLPQAAPAQEQAAANPVDKVESAPAEPITYKATWTGDTENHYLTKTARSVKKFLSNPTFPKLSAGAKKGLKWGLIGGLVAAPFTLGVSLLVMPALGAYAGGINAAGDIHQEKQASAAAQEGAKKNEGMSRLQAHFGQSFDAESVKNHSGDQLIAFADRSEAFSAEVDAQPAGQQLAFLADKSAQLGERIEAAKAKAAAPAPSYHNFG